MVPYIVADEPTKNSAGMAGETTDVKWVKSAPWKHGKQRDRRLGNGCISAP